MELKFKFSLKYKIPIFILITIGIIAIISALFMQHDHGARFWSNFHLNVVYSLLISVCGMVFLAIHSLGKSGWQIGIQRIPEAMTAFLPVGTIFIFIVILGMIFEWNHLFHWVHPEGDEVLEAKKAYLNIPFFTLRTLFYLGGWIALSR